MNKANDLCLSCGLCCDGAIFSSAALGEPATAPGVALAGVKLVDGGRGFHLPCPSHVDRRCQVYLDRPLVCRTYRCQLLKSLDRDKINFDDALAIVGQAIARRDDARRQILALSPELAATNLDHARLGLEAAMKSADSVGEKREYGGLILKLLLLREFLDKHFSGFNRRLPAGAATNVLPRDRA